MQNIQIRIGGATLGALELGRGATLALLLHGFPDNARSMLPLMRQFAAAGYRAVAPYMRGYGMSAHASMTDFSLWTLSNDVVQMLRQLTDEPAIVVGNDWGALAAMGATAMAPTRVSACISLAMPTPLNSMLQMIGNPAQSWMCRHAWQLAWRADAVTWLQQDDFALVDELWARWSPGFTAPAERISDVKRTLDGWLAAQSAVSYYRHNLRPLTAGVPMLRRNLRLLQQPVNRPTLVLRGTADQCMHADSFKNLGRTLRGPFQVRELDGGGHFLALEAPDEVLHQTLHFLQRHT